MKYIIAIILWMLPVVAGATITGSDYEIRVYQIALKTVSNLENRYNTPIQFDIPLNIIFLSEFDVGYSWCKEINYGNIESKKFKDCLDGDAVEAYYDISEESLILRNNLEFNKTYDVGSIVHEVVHYIQDRHGLTWHGNYAICTPLLEYEAMSLEIELINDVSDIQISSWYKSYVKKWKNKFADRLTGKANCNINLLDEIQN